jgi:putative hemolysin
VRVLANHLLGRIPELRDLFFCVNPFGGRAATAANVGAVRDAIRWVEAGGALATFPAGEVAHLRWRDLCDRSAWRPGRRGAGRSHTAPPPAPPAVADAPWSHAIARIARRSGAAVLPVYFEGRNSTLFQFAGLVHPLLRTALLPREFLRRRGARLDVRVGSVISARRLAEIDGDTHLTEYLRGRTFLLQHTRRPLPGPTDDAAPMESTAPNVAPLAGAQASTPSCPAAPAAAPGEPIIPPVDPSVLAADVAALPPGSLLVEHDDLAVLIARAPQVRGVLREIGRLREQTFRAAGEGTGRSIDLDTFDYDYLHLFVWNRASREVVGAYRLGATDELLPAKGRQGLYTSTLFRYGRALLDRVNPALEMGRSFVRAEYQRSYAPLMLLWKGIGQYIVRNPRYRYLIGPVSISSSYQTVSRQLMVQFLKLHHAFPGGDGLARPRHPFRPCRLPGWDPDVAAALRHEGRGDVSDLVSDLEPDAKGIPVLLRQYLKLGAKFLSFNLDPEFSDALDGLIVVDLLRTEARVLEKYMGKDGYRSFVAAQEPAPCPA